MKPTGSDIERYIENFKEEVDAAALYEAMAKAERNPRLQRLYRDLAATERKHARFWSERIEATGSPAPEPKVSVRAKILCWLARRFGPDTVLPTMARQEFKGRTRYDTQPETEGTSLRSDERTHALTLAQLEQGVLPPASALPEEKLEERIEATEGPPGPAIARLEGRHRAVQGNTLRAAVLGANDGLVSNLSLVMGVAGAEFSRGSILIAGMAGLLAGAISMALGEWLSVKSSRELYEHEMEVEARELDEHPESEAEELKLIFEAKGMEKETAADLAAQLVKDKEKALETMAREELGIDPEEMGGSPMAAAAASFFLFAVGAILPPLPFFFFGGWIGIVASLTLSGIGLFGLGAATTLMTGKTVTSAGMRSLTIGLAAAAVTFAIGKALGVSLGG
jgi:VIT1/CCC1 family predicted Fe2+/Mn2+ transporter